MLIVNCSRLALRSTGQERKHAQNHSNDPVSFFVPFIIRESRPIVHVDLRHAANEQFEPVLVEVRNKSRGQDVAEAFHERAELFGDATRDVCDDEVDVGRGRRLC